MGVGVRFFIQGHSSLKRKGVRAAAVMRDVDADAGGGANCGDGQGDHSCPGGADTPAAPASRAPLPHASGPGRDAASVARGPGMRPHIFTLSVPFPTPLEAEIAHGSLAPDAEPHQRVVGKDLTVSGRILAVRWKAEDCRLLRISVINFLDHLSLVVRTLQHFGPPVSR
ncbi:EKC/KEOPS complex subunit LAGE3-like isoform X1 [Pongo pygmaeus]|nr:EKC/KEOPS complex subunit LAGE3-like isoform X1 [Pongo pygmaeus]XP_054358843.1 EKC/KEOPS complex subunit LAGE3-like isoform X1 [Pongo pygmaeus]XP_054375729.1 EKC/KEOPS complex subunit LAGE3-like isoform X1 [Pongo abelii]